VEELQHAVAVVVADGHERRREAERLGDDRAQGRRQRRIARGEGRDQLRADRRQGEVFAESGRQQGRPLGRDVEPAVGGEPALQRLAEADRVALAAAGAAELHRGAAQSWTMRAPEDCTGTTQ